MNTFKTLLILVLSTIAFSLSAQELVGIEKTDTNKSTRPFTEYFVFNYSLTHSQWMETPDNIDIRTFNPGFSISGIWANHKGRIGYAYGLGISTFSLYSNAVPQLMEIDGKEQTYFNPLDSLDQTGGDLDFVRNKFSYTALELPLELRLDLFKRFTIAGGFKLGYIIKSKSKYIGEDYRQVFDEQIRYKQIGIPNVQRLQYSVTGKIRYRNFTVHASYPLSKIFESGKGPQMFPLTVGIGYRFLFFGSTD